MTLPDIPVRDYRSGGLLAYIRDHADGARNLLDTVLAGLGPAGHAARPFLSAADRLADRKLVHMDDPYRDEILAVRDIVGRPGPIAFSLSYEFGCTARVFDGPPRTLFRTLDWPFKGLGELIEIVHLPGPAGDWVTATWPGVIGCLHGSAPGRFAAALNQAPERMTGLGKAAAWVSAKRAFLRARGLPPPHLLRLVMETAPDYPTARRMLSETPVAAPVIFTLAGPEPGQAITIERTEEAHAITDAPVAANHFTAFTQDRWRSRGYDSEGRLAQAAAAETPPTLDVLTPPILNPLTRLAMTATPGGALSVAGYDADRQVTKIASVQG